MPSTGNYSGKTYIAIDLKSFYASVECVERGLDPLTTHLVVADASRTEKTICLAVSPSLKSYGIPGRPRLFEVVRRVKEINRQRAQKCPEGRLAGQSYLESDLKTHPDWALDYIAAPPRMAFYLEYSTRIYDVYLKYIAPEDLLVYSVDEVFIDATSYLKTYGMTAHELARTMIRDVLRTTGITATAGIGSNLYLCKVAMDIVAKHLPADGDGVRIAELDERSYRYQLWDHRPLTDFWRVGKGIAAKLEKYGMHTMGDVARMSLQNEELLYQLFGVNAELVIDHAWGWESCPLQIARSYQPETNSFSKGQVLPSAYSAGKAQVVIKEMAESLALELVSRKMVTDQLVLTIGYDIENLTDTGLRSQYHGAVTTDHYGRQVPKQSHGSIRLDFPTASTRLITEAGIRLYEDIVQSKLLIRRLNLCTLHVVPEQTTVPDELPVEMDLFSDYEAVHKEMAEEKELLEKERKVQETLLEIKKKFGKNAILKGMDFDEGATARERNAQIGGHKA